MHNLHKTPEIIALEAQWRKQAERDHRGRVVPAAGSPAAAAADPPAAVQLRDYADLKIPCLPAATVLLIEMCQDPNACFQKLSEIIQSDGGLSAKLLRLANSAYYAQTKKVSTIMRALTVLGMKEVRTIGLSYQLMNVVRDYARSTFDYQTHWEKSLLLGVVAKEVARGLPSRCVDEAFLAGLLQDIGVVILQYNKEPEYARVLAATTADAKIGLMQAEQQYLGTNHARVGSEVCANWKFPESLSQAIRYHHMPRGSVSAGDPPSEIQGAAYAASLMPNFILGNQPLQILQDLESRGIVQPGSLGEVLTRAHNSFQALRNLFENHNSGDVQIAQMMLEAAQGLRNLTSAQDAVLQPPE